LSNAHKISTNIDLFYALIMDWRDKGIRVNNVYTNQSNKRHTQNSKDKRQDYYMK